MSKSLFLALAAAFLFALAGPSQTAPKKSALDKATLEAYVRHLYVMDSRIGFEVSEPKPSAELPGFQEVVVTATLGAQSQKLKFLISRDGQKILQANVYDVAQNPFKHDLDLLKPGTAPSLGTAGAPVVLVQFSDFECPYCKEEGMMLRQNLLAAYPKQVHLYFKTYPLESIHPWSMQAAVASKCAFRQKPNEFWEFHDWAFAHQAEITPQNFRDKAMEWAKSQKDLDALQFGQCVDTRATMAEVQKEIKEGQALEISGTPTLFINGRRVQNVDWPNLRAIIDYEIEYQKTAKNAGEDCGCELKLDLPGAPHKPATLAPPKK
jgi:protein-disulfide isomerase